MRGKSRIIGSRKCIEENELEEIWPPMGRLEEKGNLPPIHLTALPPLSLHLLLNPLSSFTFTLHPVRDDLAAGDGSRGSDAVYRNGLRGVSGVSCLRGGDCSLVQCGLCSLETLLLSAAVAHLFMGHMRAYCLQHVTVTS